MMTSMGPELIVQALASVVILFVSALLLFYWCARFLLLARQPMDEVARVLNDDLRLGRRMWLIVRLLFAPPQTFTF
jgi:hypothetical protein